MSTAPAPETTETVSVTIPSDEITDLCRLIELGCLVLASTDTAYGVGARLLEGFGLRAPKGNDDEPRARRRR